MIAIADDQRPEDAAADRVCRSPRGQRLGGEPGADAAGGAGRQVDLAEQQDEDQAERDQRDERGLARQVARCCRLVRKSGVVAAKMTPRTSRPSTAGRPPGSPLRTRETYSRKASPEYRAAWCRRGSSPRGSSARLGAALGGAAAVGQLASVRHGPPHALSYGGGGGQPDVAAAPGGDQFDDLTGGRVRALDLGGDPAEVERVDAVGDLHDVVHVVRDQHDAESVCRPAGAPGRGPGASARRRARRSARRGRRPCCSRARPWRSRRSAAGRRTGWRPICRTESTVRTDEAGQRLARLALHLCRRRGTDRGGSRGRGTCSA